MNRSLFIAAGCCLCAFVALLAALHGATGRETGFEIRRADGRAIPSTLSYSASEAPIANDNLPLSAEDAEQVLTTLAGEYLRPWRQWESSPRHLYSRAAPRPIPTISAIVEMPPTPISQSDSFLVATIAVTTGDRSQPIPCVVDRITKRVQLFAEGQWLTEEEWLTKAPLPNQRSPG